jgi:hypothetical protein
VQHGHPTPLVGRDAEQSALALALRTAKQGAFRCIVIDGEPGVGKTRLATDLLERSRGRVLTLRARGHLSGSASPFGLWAELLDSHLRHRPDDDVLRLWAGMSLTSAGCFEPPPGSTGRGVCASRRRTSARHSPSC